MGGDVDMAKVMAGDYSSVPIEMRDSLMKLNMSGDKGVAQLMRDVDETEVDWKNKENQRRYEATQNYYNTISGLEKDFYSRRQAENAWDRENQRYEREWKREADRYKDAQDRIEDAERQAKRDQYKGMTYRQRMNMMRYGRPYTRYGGTSGYGQSYGSSGLNSMGLRNVFSTGIGGGSANYQNSVMRLLSPRNYRNQGYQGSAWKQKGAKPSQIWNPSFYMNSDYLNETLFDDLYSSKKPYNYYPSYRD